MGEMIKTGMKAVDFTYQTAFKEGIKLSEKVKEADKTFLVFLRYYGCRSCQIDIMEYDEEYARFQEKNAQIVMVLQSTVDVMRSETTPDNPPYDIVCDPAMGLYQTYDVKVAASKEEMRDEVGAAKVAKAEKLGLVHGAYEGEELQLPAVFLLDKEMNVLYDRRANTIGDLPTIDEMLEMV